MELPTHPEGDDTPADRPSEPARSRWTVPVATVFGALVVVVLLLHLTGVVGPAGN